MLLQEEVDTKFLELTENIGPRMPKHIHLNCKYTPRNVFGAKIPRVLLQNEINM